MSDKTQFTCQVIYINGILLLYILISKGRQFDIEKAGYLYVRKKKEERKGGTEGKGKERREEDGWMGGERDFFLRKESRERAPF